VFKDPGTKSPKHKVLVTPDAITTGEWDYDPSTWYASEAPASFYIGTTPDVASKVNASPVSNTDEERTLI
jgi:hypothetical protein